MNWLWRILFLLLRQQAKLYVVTEAKRAGLRAYLRVLQGSRRALILALAAFCILQVMILSAFGALVTAFLLWEHDFAAKIEILFWIFTALFTLPLLALLFALSERVWYRASGAAKMMDDLKKSA